HPLRRAAPSGAAGDPGDPAEPPSPGNPGVPGEPGTPGDVHHRTFGQTVDQALYTFLRTGRLPWSFRLTPGRTLEQMVQDAWHDARGHRDPPAAIQQRLLTVLTLPEARERLAIQFAADFVL